jgi:hypothetical protein
MIFLICAIVGIVIGVILNWREWHEFDADTILAGLIGCFIGIGIALLLWVGAMCLPAEKIGVIETNTTNIHALADNARYSSYVSGSVFLVQRKTDETLKYSYMYECDKGYGFAEVCAHSSYINYTTEQPHVTRNYLDFKNPVLRWLFPDVYEDEYIFYIPEGAQVINDYTIDFN